MTYLPSRDQTGLLLFPQPKVNLERRLREISYIQMSSFAAEIPAANLLPSGERAAALKFLSVSQRGYVRPLRSIQPIDTVFWSAYAEGGENTNIPFSETPKHDEPAL